MAMKTIVSYITMATKPADVLFSTDRMIHSLVGPMCRPTKVKGAVNDPNVESHRTVNKTQTERMS